MLAQVEQSKHRCQEINQHSEENDENLAREQTLNERGVVVILNQDDREERGDIFGASHQVIEAYFSVSERCVNGVRLNYD